MSHRITRRDAARLLAVVPATLSFATPNPTPAPKKAPSATLTARQRQDLAKAEQGYEKAAASIRKMKIPIGTEPAFVFRPLQVKK
jgi:hypothetical protein